MQRIEQADLATTQAVEDIAPPSAEELAAAVPVLCQPRGLPEAAPGTEAAGSQPVESQQAESQLTEVVAAGVQAAGVEAAESQPTGGQPTESQPAESRPADSQASDTEPQLPQQQQQLQQQPSSASLPQQPQSHTPKPRRIPLRLSSNALFSAIASGDNAILLRVLQSGVELVTERASDGSTPLQAAVLHNHEEVVVTLLFFRADPNAGGGYYRSPLLAAISRERPRLVKILLEAGADPSAPGVIQAAAEKNLEILRLCLAKYDPFEYNIDINSFHPSGPGAINGKTPLVAACVTGNVDVVRFLLEEAHADPTVMFPGDCVPELRSALHVSVMRQNEVLLALLLSFIPDPNVCNNITHGPGLLLHCAVNTGNANIVETLLRAGVDPNVSVPIFGTALQVACKGAALDIVECLLRHNADPNVPPPGLHPIEQICNPLHAAASVGSVAMLDMLLSHGADVRRGGGVLWVATSHAHLDVMRRLLEMDGVDINEIWRTPGYDVTRGTPLHCAAGMGNAELVKFLLDHGADPNVSTSFLGTPLDVALKSKHHKCVEELLGDGQ